MKKMNLKLLIISVTLFLITISCTDNVVEKGSKDYIDEINNWHVKRIENLKKERGWLNLVGLYWLNEGNNTIGSGSFNDIVFPENASLKIGNIIKKDSTFHFICEKGVEVNSENGRIDTITMSPDVSGNTTVLESGTLRWFIIKRGDKYGIRLRDLKAKLLEEFEGIERFPVNEDWRIIAKLTRYDEPKKIMIPTILGTIEEDYSPGKLSFQIDNNKFNLEPTVAGNGLFIVFADMTSGEETYGAGRFLYTEGPDSNGNVILDFNKAYNPPCAFTKYATCPLPPDENRLRVRITAGEKNYGKDH